MATFLLEHRHEAADCEAAFAAWQGFPSPLRQRPAMSTCLSEDHRLWWCVDAADEDAALALLPRFVSTRTTAVRVREIAIP
jgi:hypothetical protein